MAVYADRVKETTTTTGTGTYSLGGAPAGFRTFISAVGSGNLVTYVCTNNTDWEVGEGTVSSGTPDTLTRTTILASSNSGNAVSWGAGTKEIFLTASATRLATTDKTNTFTEDQTVEGLIKSEKQIVGDPGTEGTGIDISGTTYESSFKVSDIDGTNLAQTILHRHSTTRGPLILSARSNSNTSVHADVTANMQVFSIVGAGWVGSNYKPFARIDIAASASGTLSNTSSPGKIVFYTTPNGTVTPAAALTIEHDKSVTFGGTVVVPTGSASAPSLTFSSDTDTGIYRSAADTVAITAGGKRVAEFYHGGGVAYNTDNTYIAFENYGGANSFPDLVVKSDSTDKSIGIMAKGIGNTYIGNTAGGIAYRFLTAPDTTTTISFAANNGYSEIVQANVGYNNNSACWVTSGTGTSAHHIFQTRNGSTFYNQFFIGPGATTTGAQNYVAVYSGNPGQPVSVEAEGNDSNINLDLWCKGTGQVRINGANTVFSSTGALTTNLLLTANSGVVVTGGTVNSSRGFSSVEYNAGNAGTSLTINFNNGANQRTTLTGNCTFTFINPVAGSMYKLKLIQDGTGGRTVTFPGTVLWAGGVAPTLSTAGGAIDIVTFYYDGTNYFGQAATGFA